MEKILIVRLLQETIMGHRMRQIALLLSLMMLTRSALTASPTTAQNSSQVFTHFALTVYSEPERNSHIVGILNPKAKVILEARNIDATWVLGHSADGRIRGWMETRFLTIPPDTKIAGLWATNEAIFVPSSTSLATVYKRIDLMAYPVVPVDLGRAREIFELGQMRGASPHTVSKVGDCLSDNRHFLSPFDWGGYTLGQYAALQEVIDHFAGSLANDSLAAYDGLVTSAVLDPLFANPLACLSGESPLRCEYRVHRPGVAIIMFGAQDLLFTPAEDFDRNLRQIVHETIQAGVIPVVSTFPGNLRQWEESIRYNQIIVQVALDYDVPLMNLWAALETIPNHGLDADGRHLSPPFTTAGDLTASNLQRGYPLRNLVTLQALDAVWRGAMR